MRIRHLLQKRLILAKIKDHIIQLEGYNKSEKFVNIEKTDSKGNIIGGYIGHARELKGNDIIIIENIINTVLGKNSDIGSFEYYMKENKKYHINQKLVEKAIIELLADYYFIKKFSDKENWKNSMIVIGDRGINHYYNNSSFETSWRTFLNHRYAMWSVIIAMITIVISIFV